MKNKLIFILMLLLSLPCFSYLEDWTGEEWINATEEQKYSFIHGFQIGVLAMYKILNTATNNEYILEDLVTDMTDREIKVAVDNFYFYKENLYIPLYMTLYILSNPKYIQDNLK